MKDFTWRLKVASAVVWLILAITASLWKGHSWLVPMYVVLAALDALLALVLWRRVQPKTAPPAEPYKWNALYLQAYGFSGQSERREFGAVVLADLEGGFLVLTAEEFAGVTLDTVPTVLDTTVAQLRGLVVSAGRAWADFALPTCDEEGGVPCGCS